jgi:Protein of unknown function (DUF3089)
MCARRFLIVIAILTLIGVAGAFAIFQFGQDVLVKSATPKGHFQPPPAESGPDYSSDAAWLTRPGIEWPDNPVEWKPAGAPLPESGERPAAVFYIHPTTYLERDRWNAPLQPPTGYADLRTTLFLQSQASAFNDIGEIWAPRYPQAAYGAFLLDSEDARKALDLAYRDVAAAFDAFVAQSGDRPVILAGHSQGALHIERLLAEKVAGTPLAERIVAAYVVGWPIDRHSDLPRLGLPACTAPDQPGCVLSWMSFGEPPNAKLILDGWSEQPGLAGGEREQKRLVCVNPLTGTLDGSAQPAANPGTLVPDGTMRSATLEPGRVGARCDEGLLIIGGDIPPLGPYVLPGNNYHVYDYALFWGAVRQDAGRRLAAWQR